MKIGFTGTQHLLTGAQYDLLCAVIDVFIARGEGGVEELHHGDCIGADALMHVICQVKKISVVLHPPANSKKRAWCHGHQVFVLPEKEYLDRNKDIVDETDVMIACPSSKVEEVRSGTWSTIRYARKRGKPCLLVYLDGTFAFESWDQRYAELAALIVGIL